ncbi:MAG: long-chain fatty acid--CoA ligase, partial [Pseudomonadota bacterium]
FIENKLKFSPYIAEAVILGHQRPYLASIICIRFTVLSKWAEKKRITFTTYSDLCVKEEIQLMIKKEVADVNATLPEYQRINRFILLYKELDADDGELTRTKKIRRTIIGDKYKNIIDSIYKDDEKVDIDTVIHFQDGTSQRIVTMLNVIKMRTSSDREVA